MAWSIEVVGGDKGVGCLSRLRVAFLKGSLDLGPRVIHNVTKLMTYNCL